MYRGIAPRKFTLVPGVYNRTKADAVKRGYFPRGNHWRRGLHYQKNEMELIYTSPFEAKQGTIAWLLKKSYAALIEAEAEVWESEKANWEESDRNVFENPNTIGACSFLSWYGTSIIGFFSFDPRPWPAYGVIGHNCIIPEYRNQGFGKQQVCEVLRKLKQSRIIG